MLESVKIQRRQSEIRQALAGLVGKATPTEDETRSMESLDAEYRTNETRLRASLIAEDTERREAGADLETRAGREWSDLIAGFQMRQVIGALNEGRALEGKTAEVVAELRNAGGYRGIPVPLLALEARAGETVSTGTPDPMQTRPIIDRLFPASVAARMGAQMIAIGSGAVEWPVSTSAVTAGWANGETGNIPDPTAYGTIDKALAPNQTMGVQMRVTRKALLQSGEALEAAIRRDMNGAMGAELDRAIFLGTGADGQPLGVITGAATYGITSTAVDAAASWATYRSAVVRFMARNAASTPADVRALIRPEVWDFMEDQLTATSAPKFEFDRMAEKMGGIAMSSTALAAPTGDPLACTSLLTTSAGGVAPVFVGMWGAVDLIRDPFSDAASGGLRLTALTTVDTTVARGAQLELLTGVQVA
ncbi:HK97 family phage major capsid protein [Rhodobacter aestuarii]|uniref:Phage major capsid protein, HK97 family n=1 Tax=Rhodobacter aestuarii TaxID=453582 RepID=A0A1N7K4S4_9RHOB|nr:phage major capsid protein [Rhodobacter aestuarii]PTV95859.1 HK97 family phage major capsid protein [Rhodobacter aestuarii]SIS56546.1 phage major capsid protein, HK97 family [Rhodobacter aestuarii]